jgi:aryl-alcohol dehydrogenase-like predicted oxidoreductase
MRQSVRASLKRLDTDYIDLLWVHMWDFTTPVEEVMRALDDLVHEGTVLYVGISDTPAWIVSRANMLAELRGWTPFVGLQLRYSLIDRTAERDLLPMARALDLAVTPWSVLGAGVLTGKYTNGTPAEGRAKNGAATDARNLSIAETVVAVADEVGATPAQVALRWAMDQPGLIIPLIGARRLDQLDDNLGVLDVALSAEHHRRLNDASTLELGFPHDFYRQDSIRHVVSGGTFDRIDNHRADRHAPLGPEANAAPASSDKS